MGNTIQFKVEKDRVLVPVGEPCPYGCTYCYTRSGEVGPPRVKAEEILCELHAFVSRSRFKVIQLGYDGDPFSRPEHGIHMLQELVELDKNITFSTKACIEGVTLDALSSIYQKILSKSNILVAFVSLSCWDSSPIIEPHTPTPHERMVTVKNLKRIGIPTFIALRPILPNVSDVEYDRLIGEGIKAGCDGFILGPLYIDAKGRFARSIPERMLEKVPCSKDIVSWSAHSPTWTRYEDEARLQYMMQIIKTKKSQVLTSSVDVIEFVRRRIYTYD